MKCVPPHANSAEPSAQAESRRSTVSGHSRTASRCTCDQSSSNRDAARAPFNPASAAAAVSGMPSRELIDLLPQRLSCIGGGSLFRRTLEIAGTVAAVVAGCLLSAGVAGADSVPVPRYGMITDITAVGDHALCHGTIVSRRRATPVRRGASRRTVGPGRRRPGVCPGLGGKGLGARAIRRG